MSYEQGMQIDYDPATQQVIVTFRGERTTLPQKCDSAAAAKTLAEAFCRKRGWAP